MRVVLTADFDTFSEAGLAAVDLAVNLEKAGVDLLPMPRSILPGLPRAFTRLLEKDPAGRKDWMLDAWPSGISVRRPEEENLAHLFVPFPNAPGSGPSSVLPPGVDVDWPVARRDVSAPPRFLNLSDFDAPMTRADLVAAYHDNDVLVLTDQRGDQRAMEMMATGGTVIAPFVGAHQNWLHADVGYLLGPEPGALENLMARCHADPAEVVTKGRLAASWIRQTCGWPTMTAKMIRVLERL